MEKETIDRLTVAGLAIFLIMGVLYLCRDHINKVRVDMALNPPSANLALPVFNLMDLFNLDWFNNMDTASRIILGFIMAILTGTLIGSVLLYMKYGKKNAQK